MGPTKLFFSSVFSSFNPQSSSVYPHSVFVYVYIKETPDKHGAHKVVLQYCFQIVCVYVYIVKTPDKHGAHKVVFQ